ncbi:MAG TPA: D-alanine--D-alanine ligase [Gammaproteobacteria bacterium]|nr:D-alanine--D-alanine ligase [Gammaproteobacteria bacterium]
MRPLRVMLLVHATLVPPPDLEDYEDARMARYQTEFDVQEALRLLGHEVRVVGAYDDLAPIRHTLETWRPHIVFNLLEEFAGNPAFDYYVVSYLEMMGVPYTGCGPRGLLLARDKALSKILLAHHGIPVPDFAVFPRQGPAPRQIPPYPLIVKSLMEEGSVGIGRNSVVRSDAQLRRRVALIHRRTGGDAIAERYIEGRELYVTVIGNRRLTVLPFREIVFAPGDEGDARVATHRVKWNYAYRERRGIDYRFARPLPRGMAEEIARLCKRAYRILDLDGYARFDLRLGPDRKAYLLEANPNPAIAENEDSAFSAHKAGLDYEALIQRLINLGLRRAANRA